MSEQETPKSQLMLQRIYLKDMSFESPASPGSFRESWKPKIGLELNSRNSNIENTLYEVVLSITVTAKNEQDQVIYLTEVQQAGIFHIEGLDELTLQHTLGAFCPGVLFPYARETIDGLVVKGSFPPLMLAPVNFDAIYEQSKQAQVNQPTETH